MRGVVAFRGNPLVVFDAATVLGTSTTPTRTGEILVLGEEGPELGLFVDRVEAVEEHRASDLVELPQAGATDLPVAVRGVTTDGLVILDPQALLRDERLFVGHTPP